jgi:tetratricopeptide (TPR) repeat protein
MIRQDFILRLIEQFAQTLARSLNSAKEGDFENSEKNLESDFNGLLGDRYGDLDAHDEQQIIKVILDEEGPLCGRDIAALVSAYFHARYTVLNAKGDRDAALNYLERSIGILLQLSLLFEPAEFPNIVPKMEHLLHEHLETGKPLGKYQLALAGYFEKTGQYQLTIDILEETIKEQ